MTRVSRRPRDGVSGSRGHAIVIGSGLGGVLAARVLLDHFERVTMIDRDRLPDSPDHRAGTPQSRHAHGLLIRGRDIVEELFPGIDDELRAAGATVARDSVPFQIVSPVGPLPIPSLSEEFILYSRFLLEWLLRERLKRYPALRVLAETEVVGLYTEVLGTHPGGERVTGVRVRYRHGVESADQPGVGSAGIADAVLAADLVVDASGRGSKAPQWLEALGFGEVTEETITSGVGYASRFYAAPEGYPNSWQGLVINGRAPHNQRAGLILVIEDGRWHVTLGGFAGAAPPTDEAGFLQWARDLPDPTIFESIRVARPLTPIRGFRTPTNRLRHFERLTRWPAGFVVTGDAMCAFNPIYGQGMTVAATDALVLHGCLRGYTDAPYISPPSPTRTHPGFEQEFQRRLAKNVATPWLVASSEDLRWPGIALHGARPRRGSTQVRRWIDLVLRGAVGDPFLAERYVDLIMMMAPPRTLFGPRVLVHVARAAWSGRLGKPAQEFGLPAHELAALRARPAAAAATDGPAARNGSVARIDAASGSDRSRQSAP